VPALAEAHELQRHCCSNDSHRGDQERAGQENLKLRRELGRGKAKRLGDLDLSRQLPDRNRFGIGQPLLHIFRAQARRNVHRADLLGLLTGPVAHCFLDLPDAVSERRAVGFHAARHGSVRIEEDHGDAEHDQPAFQRAIGADDHVGLAALLANPRNDVVGRRRLVAIEDDRLEQLRLREAGGRQRIEDRDREDANRQRRSADRHEELPDRNPRRSGPRPVHSAG
jgi:hypothetical protein